MRVEVEDGRVTLKGSVDSWAEHDLAEEAVASVPGVQAIENELVPSYRGRRQDLEIEREIEERLHGVPWLAAKTIEVEVDDGVVTLEGQVPSLSHESKAIELARVTGVSRVDATELQIRPELMDPAVRLPHEVQTSDQKLEKTVGRTLVFQPGVVG